MMIEQQPGTPQSEMRRLAISQLRKRRSLQTHLLAYITVNLFLNAIWLATDPGGFYWPMFPLLGWGIGLALNAWDVYSPTNLTEENIEREIQRLGHR